MGISPWYDVWCDDEECILWTSGGSTRAAAAKAARAAGWRKTSDGWKCPSHRSKRASVFVAPEDGGKSAKGKTPAKEDRF